MTNFAPSKTAQIEVKIPIFRAEARHYKDDILSGLTVALALVPEAEAFAFVAGIPPVVGLYGAFMMGLVTAILAEDLA